ncbi:MAG: sigma-70 family RNA polymerase sigma factor [Candidatus Nealsonbacteria bacterium]|nr:sigma-70 family RNA polymerase sigma factor [Candidatus Nealsonbacteria bacterium]
MITVAEKNVRKHSNPPAEEPVLTVEHLSKALNVSTKTISRWRRHGLVGFRFVCDGRPRVGFLQSSVDQFVRQNPQRVFRGAEFSRMAEDERQHTLDEARRLARAGGSPSEVTKRLAERTGRSAETIRCLLRQFDVEHREAAIFPDHFSPPREETKQRIFREYRRGDSIDELAQRHCRAKSSVRRIVAEMRARRIAELPLDYIPNEQFEDERAEKAILAPAPRSDVSARKARRPAGLPSYLASLYEVPLLSRAQEGHLFRKMNYLKYKAAKLLTDLDPARPGTRLMNRIEGLYEESVAVKNTIIRANLRLVVSVAKRYVSATQSLYDLISDGNVTLMRAVEKFDFARGNKFSTYGTWAMIKNHARSASDDARRRQRFRCGYDEMLLDTKDERSNEDWQEAAQLQREHQVETILGRLDPREQKVISHRFGLAHGQEPLTLKEVGSLLGVSKERARQIETRAMNKLREVVRDSEHDVL